jgi:hypothetical protein
VVFAIAAPLTAAFAWQDVIASLGDDSVSYIIVARHLAGAVGNPFVGPWTGYHAHFPPLFPLLLAATGGADDFHMAYALVAACAILALPLIYRYAARELGSDRMGLAIVILFLLTPTAWISLKGILSESLYLLACMASLIYFETRLAEGRARVLDGLVFGVLLACVYLTRVVGIALVLAYALHLALRFLARREKPSFALLAPALPLILLVGLWYGLRPHADADAYERTVGSMASSWLAEPWLLARTGADYFFSGWIATFAAQEDVSLAPRVAFALLGVLGLAGAIGRALRNRLDGWFVLISLAIIVPWVFSPNNTRRLLYPLVALLLVCAADFLRFALERRRIEAGSRAKISLALAALPVALCLPALLLTGEKSRDRRPIVDGHSYTYRDMTEYYTTINVGRAAALAELQALTLAGFESLDKVTPPGSKVMWMRPEYVALLGRRQGVPFYYRWSPREVALEVKRSGVDHIVVSRLYKADLAGTEGDPLVTLKAVAAYSRPVFRLGDDIFVVMKVDRDALEAFLRAAGRGLSGLPRRTRRRGVRSSSRRTRCRSR